jgi:nitrogen regulatory protein PII
MSKYDAIFTIVDKGLAVDVVDAAKKAGARGGTIISGRGSGIHENEVVFAMAIEPEKEIVMILTPAEITEDITNAIRTAMRIDEPNRGIIFITAVDRAIGLR